MRQSAVLAGVLSAVTDMVDAFSASQDIEVVKIMANALVASVLAIVSNPTILYAAPQSRYSKNQIGRAVDKLRQSDAGKDFCGWITGTFIGFAASSFTKSLSRAIEGR